MLACGLARRRVGELVLPTPPPETDESGKEDDFTQITQKLSHIDTNFVLIKNHITNLRDKLNKSEKSFSFIDLFKEDSFDSLANHQSRFSQYSQITYVKKSDTFSFSPELFSKEKHGSTIKKSPSLSDKKEGDRKYYYEDWIRWSKIKNGFTILEEHQERLVLRFIEEIMMNSGKFPKNSMIREFIKKNKLKKHEDLKSYMQGFKLRNEEFYKIIKSIYM